MVHGEPAGYNIPLLSKALLGFVEGDAVSLQIQTWSDLERLVQIRGFTHWGTISIDHTTTNDRLATTTNHELPDFPIMLQAKCADSPVRKGQLYIKATLQLAGFDVVCLFSNYITDTDYPCYPFGHNQGSTEGPGLIKIVNSVTPAVAAPSAITCPDNVKWKILWATCEMTTDANAANRVAYCDVSYSGTSPYDSIAGAVQAASLTRNYQALPGLGLKPTVFDAGANIQLALPPNLYLMKDGYVEFGFLSYQAADQISAIIMGVEEWIME
jgi:hypothetical protein